MGPFAGPVVADCVASVSSKYVENKFSPFKVKSSISSISIDLSPIKPVYNTTSIIRSPLFVEQICDSTTVSESTAKSNNHHTEEQGGDWSAFYMEQYHYECEYNLINSFECCSVTEKPVEALKLNSNRIVDLFGTTTSLTKQERVHHNHTHNPHGDVATVDCTHQICPEQKLNCESTLYPQKRCKTSNNNVHYSTDGSVNMEENEDASSNAQMPFYSIVCQLGGCVKYSQGGTLFCISHGGGKRCTFEGCFKAARGKLYCSAHGGGKRCNEANCPNGAIGGSNKCIMHGGGRKCVIVGCRDKFAATSGNYCTKHSELQRKAASPCT